MERTFHLTEDDYETAENALRCLAAECERSARACETTGHLNAKAAFLQSRDRYIELAEKISGRP